MVTVLEHGRARSSVTVRLADGWADGWTAGGRSVGRMVWSYDHMVTRSYDHMSFRSHFGSSNFDFARLALFRSTAMSASFCYLHCARESTLRIHELRLDADGMCMLLSPPGELGSTVRTNSGRHGSHTWVMGCSSFNCYLHYAGEAADFLRNVRFEAGLWTMTNMPELTFYIGKHAKQVWCVLVASNFPTRLGPRLGTPSAPHTPPPRRAPPTLHMAALPNAANVEEEAVNEDDDW